MPNRRRLREATAREKVIQVLIALFVGFLFVVIAFLFLIVIIKVEGLGQG